MKSKQQTGKNVYKSHISQRTHLKYKKNSQNSTFKKQTIQLENEEKIRRAISPKRTYRWKIRIRKVAQRKGTPSCTAGGILNCYRHYGKHYGGSSVKNRATLRVSNSTPENLPEGN